MAINDKPIRGVVLDEETELSLGDLCGLCGSHAEWVVELVDEGIINPISGNDIPWRFDGTSVTIVHRAMRLKADLRLNLAGVALALELISEIESLRARLGYLEQDA